VRVVVVGLGRWGVAASQRPLCFNMTLLCLVG
jgi:hypothetical protein